MLLDREWDHPLLWYHVNLFLEVSEPRRRGRSTSWTHPWGKIWACMYHGSLSGASKQTSTCGWQDERIKRLYSRLRSSTVSPLCHWKSGAPGCSGLHFPWLFLWKGETRGPKVNWFRFMNGTDMEEIPFQKVKTRRKRGHCPAGSRLNAIACEDEFDCKELESLFQNYNLKLEQTSTLKALAVLIVMASTLALVELMSGPSLTISKGSHPVHCIIFVSLFIVTNVKYLQVTQLQQIVKLTLLFSFTFAFLCCPFSLGAYGVEPPTSPEQGMWQLMLVTFVAYSLLPVRTLLAVLFGIMVAVSHVIVTATSVTAKRQRLWRTVRSLFRFPSPWKTTFCAMYSLAPMQ